MVRFMKPNQIPISTACFDPKWFHAFRGKTHVFVDKNGVMNGLRAERLHPGKSCEGTCSDRPCSQSPSSCEFLKLYRKQIFSIDRRMFETSLGSLAERVRRRLDFVEDPEIVFLVHEAPDNPCSERTVLREFFECDEFERTYGRN